MEFQSLEDEFSGFSSFEVRDFDENIKFDANVRNNEDVWEPVFQEDLVQKDFQSSLSSSSSCVSQQQNSYTVLNNLFTTSLPDASTAECLEKRVFGSSFFNKVLLKEHDPIKFKETYFYELKIENILSLLELSQIDNDYSTVISKTQFGCYEELFNFHRTLNTRAKKILNHPPRTDSLYLSAENNGNSYSSRSSNSFSSKGKPNLLSNGFSSLNQTNGHYTDKALPAQCSDLQIKNDLLKQESEEKAPIPNQIFTQYSSKSLEELQNHMEAIENKINTYSEQLLVELRNREKYRREKEIRNNFIASYIAVETKLNQYRRKKTKILPGLIPYFNQEEGQTVEDLHAMTNILNAIERNDVDVSQLIAEYVINVGDKHNLETVIQVRSNDGVVTPLQSPTRKQKEDFTNDNTTER